MIFLNINMAGWGRYHECINMLASRDCLSPSRQIILCQNATGNLSFLRRTNWPPKLHPINFCPKFGRSPIQWKIFDSERKTLPDWYKFSRWFLALSRFSPFTFSLMAWQETKNIILINSRLFTVDLFSSFFQEKVYLLR